jgi:hypothetical protein
MTGRWPGPRRGLVCRSDNIEVGQTRMTYNSPLFHETQELVRGQSYLDTSRTRRGTLFEQNPPRYLLLVISHPVRQCPAGRPCNPGQWQA